MNASEREAVTVAVLREVAGFRRAMRLDALRALMNTLPLVIESAAPAGGCRVHADEFWARGEPPQSFAEDESVEVYDLLRDEWRAAATLSGSAAGHVLVKIERIAEPVLLPLSVVRRVESVGGELT